MKPHTARFWTEVIMVTVGFWAGWIAHYSFNPTGDTKRSGTVFYTNTFSEMTEIPNIKTTNVVWPKDKP